MDANIPNIYIKIEGTQLSTAIIDDLIGFKISSSIKASSMAKLTFFDDSAVLQENTSIDIGKAIVISIITDSKKVEVFQGDIIRIDYVFSSGSTNEIKIICYDGLYRLSKIWHSRAFVKMKISDIATKMATEAKLTGNKIDATSVKYDHLYQNNQSNLDFLRMHAKRLGYEVGMEAGGLFFKKARYKKKISSSIELEWGDNLIEIKIKLDATDVLAEVVVSSWDSDTKKNIESSAKAGSEDKVALPKTMAVKTVKSKLKSEAKLYRLEYPSLTAAEAKNIATAHLTNSSMNYLKAEGICMGNPNFKLGATLKINGVGPKISGVYYINSFDHIYDKNGYKTFFEAVTNGTF